ncbi:hypothetical protein [Streptomyces sp. FXJ7.023]|uniref:hypothetical protein n=1 Tax=Streptomyces sp. FXJ7.023 TaxID=579932 RepID=UPI00039B02ED|nr:hypothetical protein [Streptomyces sp. FXJ7.023]
MDSATETGWGPHEIALRGGGPPARGDTLVAVALHGDAALRLLLPRFALRAGTAGPASRSKECASPRAGAGGGGSTGGGGGSD